MIVAIDESNSSTGPGLYVLAAVLVPRSTAGDLRAALRALLLPRQQRLHWTKESQQRRLRILEVLARPNVEPHAYVARAPWRQHESARARSLAQILRNHCLAASELMIESREAHRDRYDRQVIAHGRHRALISANVDVTFAAPRDEPLLWAADALAGATLACVTRTSRAAEYARMLGVLPIREIA